MIKNYLKISFRNLRKHKVYSLINAMGLSIGIASCLFILAVSQNEISFDSYHQNKDRIYRMT
ncbi:MAG: ABC transporter permease, partial [Desulfobacterales bacterium]